MRGARLAREIWRGPELADKLESDAADLKRRFNRDFWVEDGEYFALALDRHGNKVDALSSNNGHLLWSGIVDKSKAKAVARHLLGPRLFSGWGVRTLAEGEGRYNPIGYHVGTVWPFDNSFIAWGLRRYGFKDEAAEIAAGILDAAEFFDGRLPEAFGGYPRPQTKYPVQYPTACSPQAWSTGTPLLLLRTMLGLEPQGEHLVVDPALPARHRAPRVARHSRPLGPNRRVRPRPYRRWEKPRCAALAVRPGSLAASDRRRSDRRRCRYGTLLRRNRGTGIFVNAEGGGRDRVELVATVLLAVATVATAWSGYQSTRWNGEQAKAGARANALRIESAKAAGIANAQTVADVSVFTNWVNAYAESKTELSDFYLTRFRKEFKPAVDAWIATRPLENPNAPPTPFAMPQYTLEAREESERLSAEAEISAAEARRDIQRASNYVLAVVLFATSLFFAGMSVKLAAPRLRVVILLLGCAVFVFTTVWIVTSPVSVSV